MKDVSSVALVTHEGELTPQGLHLCRAYTSAVLSNKPMRKRLLMSIVVDQYKQPSFLAHFREIDADPTLYN
jgi:hypothetical protein